MSFLSEKLKSYLSILLLFTAAVLLDGLLSHTRIKLDLTADKRHTLSSVTHALLAQATRSIEVHAFLPSELDAPHHRLVDAYRDKLSDFTSASNDRMVVRIYDPTDPDLNESERQDVQSRARSWV